MVEATSDWEDELGRARPALREEKAQRYRRRQQDGQLPDAGVTDAGARRGAGRARFSSRELTAIEHV